jgi:hypothetical protein
MLALTSPISGGRSGGIVRSLTDSGHGVCLFICLHPVPSLSMCGAIPPLLHRPSKFVKLRAKCSCVATVKKCRISKVPCSNLGWDNCCCDRFFVLSFNPPGSIGVLMYPDQVTIAYFKSFPIHHSLVTLPFDAILYKILTDLKINPKTSAETRNLSTQTLLLKHYFIVKIIQHNPQTRAQGHITKLSGHTVTFRRCYKVPDGNISVTVINLYKLKAYKTSTLGSQVFIQSFAVYVYRRVSWTQRSAWTKTIRKSLFSFERLWMKIALHEVFNSTEVINLLHGTVIIESLTIIRSAEIFIGSLRKQKLH